MGDAVVCNVLAIYPQYAGAALGRAGSVVLEVENKGMSARCKCLPAFPSEFLNCEEIIGEDRLALEQMKSVTAETATVGHDHPFSTAEGTSTSAVMV